MVGHRLRDGAAVRGWDAAHQILPGAPFRTITPKQSAMIQSHVGINESHIRPNFLSNSIVVTQDAGQTMVINVGIKSYALPGTVNF